MDVTVKTRSLQFAFLLFLSVTIHDFAACQGTCRPYGIDEISECTSGFSTAFHIDVVEGQAGLRTRDMRQVLIPAMNFSCAGRITKWIFPAEWEGDSKAYTELQIWRKLNMNTNVYVKAGETTIRVNNESSNEMYEYPVEPPIQFQEGDILGYFQPKKSDSQLNIYLETSDKIYTYRENELTNTFDLDRKHTRRTNYPLIGAETDPPNCGCGLVTMERMNALLTLNLGNFGERTTYPQEQVIFPNIAFTCNGEVVKWIVGATYDKNRVNYPELQIWRPTGATTYQKLNGTIIIPVAERRSRIYEFSVDPPLPFQPGDILGVFQPPHRHSKVLVDYDNQSNKMNFYLQLGANQVEPFHTFIDTNSGDWRVGYALPLVSVEIALSTTSTVTRATSDLVTTHTSMHTGITPTFSSRSTEALLSSSLQNVFATSTTDRSTLTTNVQATPALNPSPTPSVFISITSASTGNQYGPPFYASVAVVGVLLVFICILVIALLAVLRVPRKKKPSQNEVAPSPESSSSHYEVCRDVTDGPSNPGPFIPEATFDDPIYNTPTPNIPPESSPSHSAVAYAVSNVHSSTRGHALTANHPPSVVYDSAEP